MTSGRICTQQIKADLRARKLAALRIFWMHISAAKRRQILSGQEWVWMFWCYAVLDLGARVPRRYIGKRYECKLWPRSDLRYSTWCCRFVGCDSERWFVAGDYKSVATWLEIVDIVRPTLEAYGISPWSWERHPAWIEVPPLSGADKAAIESGPRPPGPW